VGVSPLTLRPFPSDSEYSLDRSVSPVTHTDRYHERADPREGSVAHFHCIYGALPTHEAAADDRAEDDLSASVHALKARLEDGGMSVEIEADGQTLHVSKLGDTYRVRPGEIVAGDGALRARLATIVDEFS
jgi:hypothetical protein